LSSFLSFTQQSKTWFTVFDASITTDRKAPAVVMYVFAAAVAVAADGEPSVLLEKGIVGFFDIARPAAFLTISVRHMLVFIMHQHAPAVHAPAVAARLNRRCATTSDVVTGRGAAADSLQLVL